MSNNQKQIQTPKINTINNTNNSLMKSSPFFSSYESSSENFNDTHKKIISFSESNTKDNIKVNPNRDMPINFSTNFQTFSRNNPQEGENELNLGEKINSIYNFDNSSFDSFNSNNIYNNINLKKPRLSLKDSRTKLKQLRDKLYPLSEEEKIKEQEKLLAVPLNKMNDEKYKLLKMHNLKKKSLPEYKSCTKFEDYYKPFENSLDKKNEYFLLKRKKSVYSSTKSMILEFNLKNKEKEKTFPLYKDQDIGVYEYWQVPLIESKVDEDNDSDDEQIKLAKHVCHLDLLEGIKYIQKNGIDEIMNGFNKEESKNNEQILNKSISV
jgi:hypothetical protein